MNVQKIVNDANILIAAMPFSFLLRWDEKVCDGTFLGTGQGSDGKRLGLGEKFRRLQEAEFFFLCYLIECMNPLCLWPSLPNNATFNHLQPIWTLPFCSKSKLHLQFDRTLDLLEHFFEARRVSAVCRSHHTAFSYHDGGRSNSVWSHWKIMKG